MAYISLHDNNHHLRRHKGMCTAAPLPYLDEDGKANCGILMIDMFLGLERFLLVSVTKNPVHIDCGSSIPVNSKGIKRFLLSFHPPSICLMELEWILISSPLFCRYI